MKKPCKECPWVNKTENNIRWTGYSKRTKERHNCHMVEINKRGQLWDVKEDYACQGCLNWMKENEN